MKADYLKKKAEAAIEAAGESITVTHVARTFDKWGKPTETTTTTDTVAFIYPASATFSLRDLLEFRTGVLANVQVRGFFKSDVDFSGLPDKEHRITWNNKNFKAVAVHTYEFEGGTIYQLIDFAERD